MVVVVVSAALGLPLIGRARGKIAIVMCCGGVNTVLACGAIRSDLGRIHLLGREMRRLYCPEDGSRFEGGHEDWREDGTTGPSNSSERKHQSSLTT